MRYVLLLESAYDNGKLCSFSHRAFRLWANSLSYARKHRTDGHLSESQVAVLLRLYQLGVRDVDELVQKGGWERVDDGFRIHDFLDVNPTEEELDNVSDARAEAGRIGGLRSGAARRKKAKPEAIAEADASKQKGSNAEAKRSNIDIDRDLEQELDREDDTDTSAVATAVGSAAAPVRLLDAPVVCSEARPEDADFEAWWRVYPRHVAKLPASKAYAARRADGRSTAALLAAAQHLAGYVDEYRVPNDKIPHASTFLNQHRDEEFEHGPPDDDRRTPANGRRVIADPIEDAKRRLRERQAARDGEPARRALA